MEGILKRYDIETGAIYDNTVTTSYYCRLNRHILILLDNKANGKVLGKIHMEIAQLLPAKDGDADCDLRLHSGLVELWMSAPSIKEKVQWHNAISDAIRIATERDNLSDFGESEIAGGYQ